MSDTLAALAPWLLALTFYFEAGRRALFANFDAADPSDVKLWSVRGNFAHEAARAVALVAALASWPLLLLAGRLLARFVIRGPAR